MLSDGCPPWVITSLDVEIGEIYIHFTRGHSNGTVFIESSQILGESGFGVVRKGTWGGFTVVVKEAKGGISKTVISIPDCVRLHTINVRSSYSSRNSKASHSNSHPLNGSLKRPHSLEQYYSTRCRRASVRSIHNSQVSISLFLNRSEMRG
jgi:hypothetical protein